MSLHLLEDNQKRDLMYLRSCIIQPWGWSGLAEGPVSLKIKIVELWIYVASLSALSRRNKTSNAGERIHTETFAKSLESLYKHNAGILFAIVAGHYSHRSQASGA